MGNGTKENKYRPNEIAFVIFILSLIMFNWPILTIPNVGQALFGYLFITWIVFIAFLYLLCRLNVFDNDHKQ